MVKYKVMALNEEKLKESIDGLSQIKPILQNKCLQINLDGQGEKDSEQLGEHFQTAIDAMFTVLAIMQSKK